jgi:hypothetical protein
LLSLWTLSCGSVRPKDFVLLHCIRAYGTLGARL